MITKKARIKGVHPYCFRAGEWADIIAVRMATPDGLEERLVFVLQFDNGEVDSMPVEDIANYELSS